MGLVLTGCFGTGTGGGWFPTGTKTKASFGFTGSCLPAPTEQNPFGTIATLEFTYADKSYSPAVNIKWVRNETYCWPDQDLNRLDFSGSYRAQGKGLTGGTYEMTFIDQGATGPDKGDTLSIRLYGGSYDGYNRNETLGGGNIKVTPLVIDVP